MLVLDPAQIASSDIYKLMIGVIVPRPIAFVSTVDAAGVQEPCAFQLLHRVWLQSAGGVFFHLRPFRSATLQGHARKRQGHWRVRRQHRF